MAKIVRYILCTYLLTVCFVSKAQNLDVAFKTNGTTFDIDDELVVSLTITNTRNSNVSTFPNIVGFKKRNRSVSHSKIKKDGKSVYQHIITQKYIAQQSGIHLSPKFEFEVNGEEVSFAPITLRVNGLVNITEEKGTIISQQTSDARLFLYIEKKQIYQGEDLQVDVGFYVPKSNTNEIAFGPNFSNELKAIQERIEPENSLINRKNITEIKEEEVTLSDVEYKKYTLYQAVFYPIRSGNLYFPSVSIDILENSSNDSLTTIKKTYLSQPFTVNVLELPEHPLKNKTTLGNFTLNQIAFPKAIKTGKIYTFSLEVAGKGNFKTMSMSKPNNDSNFDFFPPEITEKLTDGSSRGRKTFSFKVYAKDTGTYDIGAYFPFIYFNINSETFDTLTTKKTVVITGKKIILSEEDDLSIYQGIEKLDISEREINIPRITKNIANIILTLMLGGTLFLFNWKRIEKD